MKKKNNLLNEEMIRFNQLQTLKYNYIKQLQLYLALLKNCLKIEITEFQIYLCTFAI